MGQVKGCEKGIFRVVIRERAGIAGNIWDGRDAEY